MKSSNFSKLFLAIFAIAFLASCSKDQLSVDKLAGTWHLMEKKVYINGVDQQDSSTAGKNIQYTFESCDLKSVDYCAGNVRVQQDTSINNSAMMYKFGDSGNTLIIDYDANASTASDRITTEVSKLTKTMFVIEYETIVIDTQRTVLTFEKH